MDESEFLRGIEGEGQNGKDLVDGAEHLLRLKKQVGYSISRSDDLELEKEAEAICKRCKKAVEACICERQGEGQNTPLDGQDAQSGGLGSEKLAKILADARTKTAATHQDLHHTFKAAKNTLKGYLSTHPTARAAAIGGAASGTIGAAMGAANSPGDRIGGAVSGGVTGAALGAGTSALYHHLNHKLASAREKTASSIVEHLKDVNPGLVAATGAGALIGGIGTYLSSRPQKDTGKSKSEEELEGKVEAQKSQPERGLLSKMHHRNTELEHGYAKAFREHPHKAALIGTVSGALGGYGLGRLAGGIAKMRGGK